MIICGLLMIPYSSKNLLEGDNLGWDLPPIYAPNELAQLYVDPA